MSEASEKDDVAPVDSPVPPAGAADAAPMALDGEPAGTATPTPADVALAELKTEVLSAVRGAITGVMSRHQPALATPELDLDLDFSLREPRSDDEPDRLPHVQQALTQAMDAADQRADPEMATAVAAAAGQSLMVNPQLALQTMQLTPAAPARRPRMAWTTAALLSMAGIAVGAGTATLLIDPAALSSLKDRIDQQLRLARALVADETQSDTAAAAQDASATASVAPGHLQVTHTEPAGTIAADTQSAFASPVPVAVEPLPVPNLGALADAVRVATAGETAAFAHRLEDPLIRGAVALSHARLAGLDALAALPPEAAAPPASNQTGSEVTDALPGTSAQPNAEAETATAKAEPAPSTTTPEPALLSAEPLSAIARANAALAAGDVEAARLLLQAESQAGQVEGMLLLARSYDPSYLAAIGIDRAKGKREIAEQLYRAWYARSVKLGLVSEGINLDRLIRAMAQSQP